jgi:hypothetical protein
MDAPKKFFAGTLGGSVAKIGSRDRQRHTRSSDTGFRKQLNMPTLSLRPLPGAGRFNL